MKRSTEKALIAGGAALGLVGLVFALTRTAKAEEKTPKPSTPGPGPTNNLDALLDDVAATRNGPDYDTVLTYGAWTIDREKQFSAPGLKPGSVVRIRMYPTYVEGNSNTGYGGPHYDYGAQITKATQVGNFTIYDAKWTSAPGGLDPNATVTFTSADVASVVKRA